MSKGNISWGGGKGGLYVKLTTLPPSCADCLEIWEPQPPGTLRACPSLYRYGSEMSRAGTTATYQKCIPEYINRGIHATNQSRNFFFPPNI